MMDTFGTSLFYFIERFVIFFLEVEMYHISRV